MEDGDSMTKHLNVINTLVIQLICVDINMEEKDKCISMLCSLPDSWDNLVVVIGSTTQSILEFKDIVSSLLFEEMRRKSMENHSINALSRRLGHCKYGIKATRERFEYRGRSKSLRDSSKKLCWKCSKPGHFMKNYRSKSVERGKGSEDTLSIENNTSSK